MSTSEWQTEALPFLDGVNRSIDAWALRTELDGEAALTEAGVAPYGTGAAAKKSAAKLFGAIPTSLGLKRPRCGWNPLCMAANWAKGKAESIYANVRGGLERSFLSGVAKRADAGVLTVNEQIDAARTDLHNTTTSNRAALRRGSR